MKDHKHISLGESFGLLIPTGGNYFLQSPVKCLNPRAGVANLQRTAFVGGTWHIRDGTSSTVVDMAGSRKEVRRSGRKQETEQQNRHRRGIRVMLEEGVELNCGMSDKR